ncbi:MAG TPA: metalloregulator ArsR/SmtB family transcription factor [Conexivisphaerales archaeon]|nr:metalloregulator ArsR/SmtB family transcription factor [Conexivisphaerales archaeon]
MTASSDRKKAEEELYRLQAEFCKGMAHPKRILILNVLKEGEKSVNELSEATSIPQANLSQHLSLLRQLGLLNTRRSGANIYYSIADKRIVEACSLVREAIGERLRRDRRVIEAASAVAEPRK